jgi:PAS domain S-box-containing protein
MTIDPAESGRRAFRLLPVAVLVVFAAASLATFFVTRGVVRGQEERLLEERGDEVAALLGSAIQSVETSLRILGTVGSSSDPASLPLFTQVATPLVEGATRAVGVVARADGGFRVLAAVGDGPAAGASLTSDRAALAARALSTGQLVSVRFTEGPETRVAFALPALESERAVAYEETVVTPNAPVAQTPGSPYRELRVAVYASPTDDAAKLILTTEARVPLTGRVDRDPLPVGADRWLVAVGARESLVGAFADNAPWYLLGGGLLATLFATFAAEILARRRSYALRLVAEGTKELDETSAFLDRLLTAGPVLVKRITLPGREISYVSPNVERVMGVTEGEALASGFLRSLIHPEDRDDFDAALDRLAAGSTKREVVEHRIGRNNGAYRWASAVLVPEPDETGAVVAVLGYVLDVDDRRRAEEAQHQAQEVAEAANHSKNEFLSRMSHELRTPLNAVLGFGQLLELESLTDDQHESVDQILKGGRHLLDLINEVLDISRIEAGELALSPEAVLARELIQDAVDLIRPIAEQHGIQLSVDPAGACDSFVFTDRQRAKQVLLNLLSNAVKYNRPRGTVAVTCEQPNDTRLRVMVIDTGPGIGPERLGRIFTPFDRLGAEATEVEGTGIGLALSKRLTEAMGGILTVTSTPGQGSTFAVELPRVEGPVERYERLGGDAEPVAEVTAPRHKVLHVEDNLSNLKLVERIVARRGDIEVVAAIQGGLALELAHEHRPVLVLLDVHLPDISGETVLQRLRDDPVTASTPVVVISADATPGQIQRLLAAGATAYLTKPIDVPELHRVLDDALSLP